MTDATHDGEAGTPPAEMPTMTMVPMEMRMITPLRVEEGAVRFGAIAFGPRAAPQPVQAGPVMARIASEDGGIPFRQISVGECTPAADAAASTAVSTPPAQD